MVLRDSTAALATALTLQDPRLVRVMTRNLRLSLGNTRAEDDGSAVKSLLLRQIERAANSGDFTGAQRILGDLIFSQARGARGPNPSQPQGAVPVPANLGALR